MIVAVVVEIVNAVNKVTTNFFYHIIIQMYIKFVDLSKTINSSSDETRNKCFE